MNFCEHTSPPLSPPTSPATPIVFVVDDDVSVRESLELLIRSAGWQPKISASAEEFLVRSRVLTPSCLVLDVNLPDINGLDLQNLILERVELPIIFITGRDDIPMTVQAMKAGAVEFLRKPLVGEVLLSAIRHALTLSETSLRHEEQRGVLLNRFTSLSKREREIMEFVVSGQLNKQAAVELGISEVTVKAHRGRMMRKMKAASLADLIKMALELSMASEREGPSTRHDDARRSFLHLTAPFSKCASPKHTARSWSMPGVDPRPT
jgi:FixJ family two-component response regulator